jgi:FKBP-type peptidyl-prolyl cis-trans isomerase SlpA
MADEIDLHSRVLMHYSIALTNGNLIESSFDDDPVEITMGGGDLSEGMELALFGLKEGDEQTLTLTAEQAFGVRDDSNINAMPLSDFPDGLTPEVGMSYVFETPRGENIPGTILSVDNEQATVDFNHPLSGQDIVFRVEILGVDNTHNETPQDAPTEDGQ